MMPFPDSMTRARALVAALVDEDVLTWFYAPGSRNAPLGYALAELAGISAGRRAARSRDDGDSPRGAASSGLAGLVDSTGEAVGQSAERETAGRISLHVRIDERDAAFMALGAARATGRPAAVVMTSGTAVGNALPAVMEAYHSQVPLLVISADRPASLRGSGANQTTIQPGIFGGFVRFEADLQPGDSLESLEFSARSAVAACCGCAGVHEAPAGVGDQDAEKLHPLINEDSDSGTVISVPGPAHLNISFVEPLVPPEVQARFEQSVVLGREAAKPGWWSVRNPRTFKNPNTVACDVKLQVTASGGFSQAPETGLNVHDADSEPAPHEPVQPEPNPTTSGDVLIVGDLPREDFPGADVLWRAVAAGGVPVFAEPTTRWRDHPNAVMSYSRLAGRPGWAAAIRRILVVGRPTLTRPITRLLHEARAEFLDAPGLAINLDGGEHRRWTDAAALAASLEENPGGGSRLTQRVQRAVGGAADVTQNDDETEISATPADISRWLELSRRIERSQVMSRSANFGNEADFQTENAVSWLEQWRQTGAAMAGELCAQWGIYQVAREIWLQSEAAADLFLGSSSTIRAFDAVAGLGADLVSLGSLGESGNSDIPGNPVPVSNRESGGISVGFSAESTAGAVVGEGADFEMAPHEPATTATRGGRRVYANRGLAGIDGTIACAWGAAVAGAVVGRAEMSGETSAMSDGRGTTGGTAFDEPIPVGKREETNGDAGGRAVRVVLGDVSFFHDLGALVRGRLEAVPNLQVIVLDNGGGQIFAGLEHGYADPGVFARLFLTPQVGDPVALARAAGWRAENVRDLRELRAALACPIEGLSLLRVVL